MKDRVVQHPHRYQLVPVAGESDTYDIIAKPGTITEAGTPINKATLLSDETAALYGLTGEDATVDKAFVAVASKLETAVLRDIVIQLQLAANSTNIDAWADLITDFSMIDKDNSYGIKILNNELSSQTPQWGATSAYSPTLYLGQYAERVKYAGRIPFDTDFNISSHSPRMLKQASVWLNKVGSPTDSVRASLVEYDSQTSQYVTVAVSTNTINGSSITGSLAEYVFDFNDDAILRSGPTTTLTYYLAVERATGLIDSANYYNVGLASNGLDAMRVSSTNQWASLSSTKMACKVIFEAPTCKWKPVVSTKALVKIGVVSEQVGTVKWYVSDDNVTWTEIPSLMAMTDVAFTSNNIRLKCELAGSAKIQKVGWGGL